MELRLRPAVADDRGALEALMRRASLAWDEYREALTANPEAIVVPAAQIADSQVWVLERQGEAVGFSVVLPREDGGLELDGLFVEPHAWRQGLGRTLVDTACDRARATGAETLHVVANPLALEFYKACGFELTGRCDTQFGIGLLMRRGLVET